MKLFLIIFCLLSTILLGEANDILGTWITEEADNGNQIIVEFYIKDELFFGRIKDLTMPNYPENHIFAGQPRRDGENKDKKLRKRFLIGIDFVYNFSYKDGEYINGEIYNPAEGKTYYCKMSILDSGQLLVKGSLDKFGIFSKKQFWIRYSKN